jgi:PAS domain S-box-containing protein
MTQIPMISTEEIVYKEKVRQLYSLLPAGIIATFVNGLIIVFLHWNLVPHNFLIYWLSVLIILSNIRFAYYVIFRIRSEKIINYHFWGGLFKIGILLIGIAWGTAAFFSFFHNSEPHRILIAYVLGGMAAGSAGMYSAFKFNYYGFAIPAVLPQIILFIRDGSPINIAMAGMLAFFIVLLSFSAESTRKVIDRAYHLGVDKDTLIVSLSKEKETTQITNYKLNDEINRRRKSQEELHAARDELENKVIERTTALQNANIEIKRSEEVYRSIVETSQEGIWIISSEREITFINSRMALLLKYDISEIINHNIESFVDKDYLHNYEWTNRNNEIRQINLLRKDNSIITVLESVSELPIPIGNRGKYLCMVTDITEIKTHEEEIRRYTTTLEEKNDELDSFAHSVSHDLRNPLLTTMGFAQMLLEDYSDILDDTAKDFIQRIIDSTKKMNSIIDALLKLSKLSRLELIRENVSISDLAGFIVNDLKNSDLTRNVQFQIESNMYCKADPGLITIALRNLLGNAWKYTVKVENAIIKFYSLMKDNTRIYAISDNGVGFDMTNVSKLFKPFQRLHSEKDFTGTGIGLVIVDRVIKKHGGKIWAESKPGSGTTFYFTIGPFDKNRSSG